MTSTDYRPTWVRSMTQIWIEFPCTYEWLRTVRYTSCWVNNFPLHAPRKIPSGTCPKNYCMGYRNRTRTKLILVLVFPFIIKISEILCTSGVCEVNSEKDISPMSPKLRIEEMDDVMPKHHTHAYRMMCKEWVSHRKTNTSQYTTRSIGQIQTPYSYRDSWSELQHWQSSPLKRVVLS
jgi:hypothetical protein